MQGRLGTDLLGLAFKAWPLPTGLGTVRFRKMCADAPGLDNTLPGLLGKRKLAGLDLRAAPVGGLPAGAAVPA